ncbi:MAG: transposase [Clostridia bacterium]|jgi:transposase|nr:transposase [Clostridia bacterium]
MRGMKGFKMYIQIKQLKDLGFSKARTAKQLDINRETVTRYWDMSVDEFERQLSELNRINVIAKHEKNIIRWIKQYPTITAAQVCDWLKEHYEESFKERTVSRYVKDLRSKYHLLKSSHPREYEAIEELPMGQQMQVDFGEKWMKSIDGTRVKVHFAAFVLSNSRYKWGYFQTRSFTTTDLVIACEQCMEFIGGMPYELVFDQDSIVSVSENYGDIIHTYEFEKFRQNYGFKIFLCRRADPESKGKIESVVKFIKYNFLENRLFADESILNSSFLDWLDRTGNAKIHSTTKKVPAEVFDEERDYLRPLLNISIVNVTTITRTVRKDNTILYDSNRYSLPLGTYGKHNEVCISVVEGQLVVTDTYGDRVMCTHNISTGRGVLVKSTDHKRDKETTVNSLQEEVANMLENQLDNFLNEVRRQKRRYCRDQFTLLKTLINKYGKERVILAVSYCENNRLYSINYVKDYLILLSQPKPDIPVAIIPVSNRKYHVTTEKRSLEIYAKVGGTK